MSFTNPFSLRDVTGIPDGSVQSSTCFSARKNFFVSTDSVPGKYKLFFYAGRNDICNVRSTNIGGVAVDNVISHTVGFDKPTYNNGVLSTGHIDFRVISYGIRIRNVTAENTASGSYEIADFHLNLTPDNFRRKLSGDQSTISLTTYFMDNYKDDITQNQNYVTGSVDELNDYTLKLSSKVNNHKFIEVLDKYNIKLDSNEIDLLNDDDNINFLRNMFDTQFCGKVVFLDLDKNQNIFIDIVCNYETLSDRNDLLQFSEVSHIDLVQTTPVAAITNHVHDSSSDAKTPPRTKAIMNKKAGYTPSGRSSSTTSTIRKKPPTVTPERSGNKTESVKRAKTEKDAADLTAKYMADATKDVLQEGVDTVETVIYDEFGNIISSHPNNPISKEITAGTEEEKREGTVYGAPSGPGFWWAPASARGMDALASAASTLWQDIHKHDEYDDDDDDMDDKNLHLFDAGFVPMGGKLKTP
jgi:hypothetical protein